MEFGMVLSTSDFVAQLIEIRHGCYPITWVPNGDRMPKDGRMPNGDQEVPSGGRVPNCDQVPHGDPMPKW